MVTRLGGILMEEKQYVPLEKILTVTATEYASSQDKCLYNYDLVGVHAVAEGFEILKEELRLSAPEGTEAIIYRTNIASSMSSFTSICTLFAEGTALIPKKGEKK